MNEDLARIRGYVASLVRRERALIVGRIVLQAGLLVFLVAVVASIAAAWRVDRSTAVAGLVIVAGVGAWAAVAAPMLVGWRRASDPVRQARLVERMNPDLRGRLLTAVERTEGPRGQESPALLGLVAKRAAAGVAAVAPSRVHPGRHLIALAAATAFAWLVAVVVSLVVPGGPAGTARWWLGGGVAEASMASATDQDAGERARVGDLVLEYVYPAYTGLEPRQVPNSTGDAHAPPGTVVRVTAKSGDPIEAAALVAYDEPALDAEVGEEGRSLHGSFSIDNREGKWHFVTYRGGEAVPSRDFAITPEADLAPEVMLDAGTSEIEVAADERVPFTWKARDDYGLSKVVIEIDGKERGDPLEVPHERRADLEGRAAPTPAMLGLRAGDRVRLDVAAWDNDDVSGHKVGRSRTIEVVVLGASGMDARAEARERELRDLLVDMLAPFLEEKWPPGGTSGDFAKWGDAVGKRYDPLEQFIEQQFGGHLPKTPEGSVVKKVTDAGGELVRYTQTGFTPKSSAVPRGDDVQVVSDLRDKSIGAIENAILALDYMLDLAAEQRVMQASKQMQDVAKATSDRLDRGDMEPQELLAELDQMDRSLQRLGKTAGDLRDEGLKGLIDQRSQELEALTQETRDALANGKTDDANRLARRLSSELDEMGQSIQDQFEQRQQDREGNGKKIQELLKKLDELEKQQRDLKEQTSQLRQKSDQATGAEADQLWAQLEQKSQQHAADASSYAAGQDGPSSFGAKERARNAADSSSDLRDAIATHDLAGAKRALQSTRYAWDTAEAIAQLERMDDRKIRGLQRQLDQIESLMDKLDQASQKVDPKTAQQVRALEQQQQQISEQLSAAEAQAEQVTQKFTQKPEGVSENLDAAQQSMQDATSGMRQGQPMQAEGPEATAAQRIADARDALKQALQDQQNMDKQGQGGGGQQDKDKGKGGKDEGGSNEGQDQQVQLPNPESFKTPEEYRQELMEGMEGDVPEEYRALKKRYYEELVHQ